MFTAVASCLQKFFGAGEKRKPEPTPRAKHEERRKAPGSSTMTMRALNDLGDSIATSTHIIYGNVRLYLCVSMEPKPEQLRAQMERDRRAAKGMFKVDEMWSAAEVNKRWAKDAVITDEQGQVIDQLLIGARGMTDAGAKEVFFEFNALDVYPEKMFLSNGGTRIRIR